MARKVKLSPVQGQILWMLEEAGEESLGTVKATLRLENDETLDRELAGLERLNFVFRSVESGVTSVILTSQGREALTR